MKKSHFKKELIELMARDLIIESIARGLEGGNECVESIAFNPCNTIKESVKYLSTPVDADFKMNTLRSNFYYESDRLSDSKAF